MTTLETKAKRSRANRWRHIAESKRQRLIDFVFDLADEYNEGCRVPSGFAIVDAELRFNRPAAYVICSTRVEIRLECMELTLWERKPTATERGKLAEVNIYGFVRAKWRYQPWALKPRATKAGGAK